MFRSCLLAALVALATVGGQLACDPASLFDQIATESVVSSTSADGSADPNGQTEPPVGVGPDEPRTDDAGPAVPPGEPGAAGPQGPVGPQGPAGEAGPAGASPFTLHASSAVFYGGNVAVGVDSPAEKLTVAGVIHSASGGFRFPDGSLLSSAGTLAVTGATTLSSTLAVAGNKTLSGSTVSIGASSPEQRLSVAGGVVRAAGP